MAEDKYTWTDDPMVSGVAECNTDVVNDCLMHLKYDKKDGGSSFSLFDSVIKDHILTYEESKGYALQGTWVYKNSAPERYGYPDFYTKCIEEKNAGEETSLTIGENTITIYKNSNGHVFYNISDKEVIDELFEQKGVAWYYGVDEENERIFLPRNNKFIQCTTDTSKVNEFNEAGLPNIEASAGNLATGATAEGTGSMRLNATGSCTLGTSGGSKYQSLTFNASDSNEIYGSSDTVQPPSVSQLLYIVVGNTEQTQAITDVTEVTTSENDTIPLFIGQYFDFKPNNVSWLKAGTQQNSGGIYESCYNELVNELTNPKYGFKVVEESEMISGVDYSEYWKVNQDEIYFVTPTKLSYSPLNDNIIPVTDEASSSGGVVDLSNAKSDTAQLYFKVANAVENLQLLDAGKVLESLADKVDKDSDLFNGQWVFNPILLTTSTAADQALDLSNYLPEDGYNYEVMLSCQSYSRETEYNRWIYTDIMLVSSPAWTDLWCNTNTRHSTNSFIVPVGTGRVIYIGGSGMNILEIFAKGYRRLGAIKQ